MMNTKVIAYDLGTGGLKASLFSSEGNVIDSVFIAYTTISPKPDWQEQAPDDWWKAIISSTRSLLDKTGISSEEIVSLAISGHSLGVVPIGKNGELLRESTPIWSDQRAIKEADSFFNHVDQQEWYMYTGNGFPPACYSLFKIMWYKVHEPEMFAQIDKVIGTKDYCNYRLTGRLCTDFSYASGSGVFDLERWNYRTDYIEAAQLDQSLFPEIIPSDGIMGKVTKEAATATGLKEGTLVVAGGVDNSCMALGARGFCSGRVYTSLGTSAWVACVANQPILDYKYRPYVFAHVINGLYASATCIFSAGNSLRWVRDNLCQDLLQTEKQTGEDAYAAMDKLAAQSVSGANGILFNPSLAGGSSLEPSSFISGAFVGLKLGHTRADLIRATLEGITLNLKEAYQLLNSYLPEKLTNMLMVGGGAKSKFWLQLFADIFQCTIYKSSIDQEAASLGAAALALKGAGIWSDYQIIDKIHHIEHEYLPDMKKSIYYETEIEPRFSRLTEFLGTFTD